MRLTGDSVLGLVFKKGFGFLVLVCLALAGPVVASPSAPPSSGGGPAAEEPQSNAPPERERVQIRSVNRPAPVPEPVDEPAGKSVPRDKPVARDGGLQLDMASAPPASRKPRAVAPAGAAPPAAATSAESPDADASPAGAKNSPEPAGSNKTLSERVVPQPVRKIVEEVPGEVWAVLAGLALLALGFAAWSWVAAVRARRLRRQRESLLREIGLLQAALLPSVSEDLPVSVAYRPADGPRAGGDFYDAFTLPGGSLGVILGDVSGRGRDALARTTFVRYTLRAYLEAGLEPRAVLKVASGALGPHLDGGFASVALAVHHPESGRFTYACAGHAPPVVAGASEPLEPVIACAAPPLGIGEPTGFRQSTFTLGAGARACLYTDGVIDARADGRVLGVPGLERLLAALPADADAEAVLGAVTAAADEVGDDMAVCLITAAAGVPASGPRIEELEVDDQREVGDSLERFLRACGVALSDVPGVLREAGEAARREGSVTVRVRVNDFRPGVDVVPGNVVRLAEHRRALG